MEVISSSGASQRTRAKSRGRWQAPDVIHVAAPEAQIASSLRSSLVTLFFAFPPAHAEDAASFYRGKQIRFIVGSAPGGTYDLVARAVARHMGAHIPGNPSIIVQNQPTASGVVMTNQLYALGPKDGTAIGVPLNGIPAEPLLKPNVARYDADKLIWLGSTTREPYVAYVWHTAPVQSLSQLLTEQLVVGGTTPGSTMVDFPLLTNAVLGTKFKIVPGYGSTPLMNQAMERGETQGVAALGWEAVKAQLCPFSRRQGGQSDRPVRAATERLTARCAADDRPRQVAARIGRRWRCCFRAPTLAGPSSCRRTCRRTASRPCGAPSTPR